MGLDLNATTESSTDRTGAKAFQLEGKANAILRYKQEMFGKQTHTVKRYIGERESESKVEDMSITASGGRV